MTPIWTRSHSGARLPACTPGVLGAARQGGSTKAKFGDFVSVNQSFARGFLVGPLSAS
jgi:hypothetical protein